MVGGGCHPLWGRQKELGGGRAAPCPGQPTAPLCGLLGWWRTSIQEEWSPLLGSAGLWGLWAWCPGGLAGRGATAPSLPNHPGCPLRLTLWCGSRMAWCPFLCEAALGCSWNGWPWHLPARTPVVPVGTLRPSVGLRRIRAPSLMTPGAQVHADGGLGPSSPGWEGEVSVSRADPFTCRICQFPSWGSWLLGRRWGLA